MIIYGSNSRHLKSSQSQSAICPDCGTKGSLVFSVFSRHAHIFWIPLFPIGRTGAAQCQHCKYTIRTKEMSREIKDAYTQLKSETRTPIWQFAGLFIIGAFITWVMVSSEQNEALNQEYIEAPLIGDVYRYKTETDSYSTLRVNAVTADSVYVSPHEYETNKITAVSRLQHEGDYQQYEYALSLEELQTLYEEGTIYEVDR